MFLNNRIFTALITPMLPDRKIDYIGFFNIIKFQEKYLCGILALGSTGEGVTLPFLDKKKIINFFSVLVLTVPLLINLTGYNQSSILKYLTFLNRLECVDGLLISVPSYIKPGFYSQLNWFSYILSNTYKKCMLYNIPSRTGVSVHYSVLNYLALKGKIWALKESSGNILFIKSFLGVLKEKILVYCGEDNLICDFFKNSSYGIVSVISNIWPFEITQYTKRCLKKYTFFIEDIIWKFSANSCFIASNPIPIKQYMSFLNKIRYNSIRPPLYSCEIKNFSFFKLANYLIKLLINTIEYLK